MDPKRLEMKKVLIQERITTYSPAIDKMNDIGASSPVHKATTLLTYVEGGCNENN